MNPPFSGIMSKSKSDGASKVRRSDKMLADLLALNEEMIAQLRLERLSVVGTTDFLTGMIDQHEQAALKLRDQLRRHEATGAHSPALARAALAVTHS